MRTRPRITRCLPLLLAAFSLLAPLTAALRAQTPEQAAVIQLIRQGRDAMQLNDLAQAETLFQQAATRAPELSDAWLALGLVQLRRGQADAAAQSLTRATQLNPRLPGAHLFLGIAQNQLGQPDSAIAALQAELTLRPGNVEALTWLGIVQLSTGHPDAAIAPLDEAAAAGAKPDPQLLYYRGRAHMLVAESAYRQLSELDPDSVFVHRGMAESFDIAGQPEKAIAEYEEALRKDPANPDLYEALGEANLKMSRTDAARDAFEHELKLNPASPIALYNLGRIAVEHGQPQPGIALLRRARQAHAGPAPTSFYLGLGLAETGQNEEAAQSFEQALASRPSPFIEQGCWYQLGRVYQKLGRKADSAHALTQLKQLLDQQQRAKDATSKRLAAHATSQPAGSQPAGSQPAGSQPAAQPPQ